MCHISVIVEEVEPKPKPVKKAKPTTRRAQQAAAMMVDVFGHISALPLFRPLAAVT